MDATIFVYHFTGASTNCRTFLERCEQGDIKGITSVTVLAEATHRLMMIEAVSKGLVSPGNVAQKLRRNAKIIRKLHVYQEQIEKIPLMGIHVEPLDLKVILSAMTVRRQYGLMTNDSLIVATALARNVSLLASADPDFAAVEGIVVHRPTDIAV